MKSSTLRRAARSSLACDLGIGVVAGGTRWSFAAATDPDMLVKVTVTP